MRINVRQSGDRWLLTQQGDFGPKFFKVQRDALAAAAVRFRSATRLEPSALSISYVRCPSDEAAGLNLEPETAS